MDRRIAFLPSAFAAALASTVLTIVFALYFPYTAIICTFSPGPPNVTTGTVFFGKPRTTMLTMQRNGVCAVDERIVRCSELTAQLRTAREQHPTLPLELNGDRRLPASSIFEALAAARDAGYTEAIVFGREHSLLEIASRE